MTAGGGVANVDEGRAILRAGADKLTVNTAAVRNPPLLTALAAEFGSQAVVLAIDAKRVGDRWEAFVRGGNVPTGIDVGVMEATCGTGFSNVTALAAVFDASAVSAAVIVITPPVGGNSGAVYKPAAVMIPNVAFPPTTLFTDQATAGGVAAPPSAALNVCVSPPRTVALEGVTASCPFWGFGSGVLPPPLIPPTQPERANAHNAITQVHVSFTARHPCMSSGFDFTFSQPRR